MGHIGRPRREGVIREQRECRHHGPTDHAYYGHSWVCMACHREDVALRQLLAGKRKTLLDPQANDQTAGPSPRRAREEFCPDCFIVLPASGRCDDHE